MINIERVRFDETKVLSYYADVELSTNRIFVHIEFNVVGLRPILIFCGDVKYRDDLLQKLDLIFKPNRW
jgi:hypothetical protein